MYLTWIFYYYLISCTFELSSMKKENFKKYPHYFNQQQLNNKFSKRNPSEKQLLQQQQQT